jgi:hypothetical protein
MQNLTDEIQSGSKKVQSVRERVKSAALEVETLRIERAEEEKAVKICRVEEDDGRLVPLYDWWISRPSHPNFHVNLSSQ